MLLDKIELEPGEEILKTVRKHWFVITIELLAMGFLLLLPLLGFVGYIAFTSLTTTTIDLSAFLGAFIFGSLAFTFLVTLATFAVWTHYYLDLWIITDRRIIVVDQISFFNRNVSIFRLERMQDIQFWVSGLIATLLNFGTLKAQTAGAHASNFVSSGLPDPKGLQATIQKAMDIRLRELDSMSDTTPLGRDSERFDM
jgi:hypothetical protein